MSRRPSLALVDGVDLIDRVDDDRPTRSDLAPPAGPADGHTGLRGCRCVDCGRTPPGGWNAAETNRYPDDWMEF